MSPILEEQAMKRWLRVFNLSNVRMDCEDEIILCLLVWEAFFFGTLMLPLHLITIHNTICIFPTYSGPTTLKPYNAFWWTGWESNCQLEVRAKIMWSQDQILCSFILCISGKRIMNLSFHNLHQILHIHKNGLFALSKCIEYYLFSIFCLLSDSLAEIILTLPSELLSVAVDY